MYLLAEISCIQVIIEITCLSKSSDCLCRKIKVLKLQTKFGRGQTANQNVLKDQPNML